MRRAGRERLAGGSPVRKAAAADAAPSSPRNSNPRFERWFRKAIRPPPPLHASSRSTQPPSRGCSSESPRRLRTTSLAPTTRLGVLHELDVMEEVGDECISPDGSSGFLVGGTGHERASKRPHLRTVDRWNADWGALALMVGRWLVPLIPFPSYKLCASDRPEAVKGARFARRSEPLTARTDLESYEGEGKGILQPSSHLPTKNPEEPAR